MDEFIRIFVLVGVFSYFIFYVIKDIKEEKVNEQNVHNDNQILNNKNEKDSYDRHNEKYEFYKKCYDNFNCNDEKNIFEIGEWERIVRKNLCSFENAKLQFEPNREIKVLIGDYNLDSVSNSVWVLESMGLKVSIAHTGYEIIRRINNGEKYDVIITNNIYDRGDYDGIDLLRELKSRKDFKIPIVVLTIAKNKRELFIEKGFDEYMEKFLEQKQILNILPNVIEDLKFIKRQ